MRFISLRTKLLAGVLGIIVLLGGIFIVIALKVLPQKLEKELHKRTVLLAEDIASESTKYMLTEKYIDIKLMLYEHKNTTEDVRYIFILGSKDKVLAHTFREGFPTELIKVNLPEPGQRYRTQYLKTEEGKIVDIATPILNGELGTVRLGMTAQTITRSIADIIKVIAFIIVGVFIFGAVLAGIFAKSVTRDILRLTDRVKKIGRGDLERIVNVRSNDEIGLLAEEFNNMTLNLKRTISKRDELNTEIAEQKKVQELIRDIARGVSGGVGESFFKTLVKYLSETFDLPYAFVARVTGEDYGRADTVAVYANEDIVENFGYTLMNTPCNNVRHQGLCCYKKDVQSLFPEDHLLADMGVESYVGIPLRDSSGKVAGILVVMGTKPLGDTQFIESMMKIFAVRVSSELERIDTKEEMKYLIDEITAQKEFSETIFNDTGSGMLVMDKDGFILRINQAGGAILNIKEDDISGTHITSIHPLLEEMRVLTDKNYNQIVIDDTFNKTIGYTNSSLLNSAGKKLGIIIVFKDLTDIIKLKEEVEKKKKFEGMGRLVSGVAHEVRNPLNAISALSEALSLDLEGSEEQTLLLANISGQVKRLSNLMNELLNLGRPIEQSGMSMVPVESICLSALELLRASNPDDNHEINIIGPGDDRFLVFADIQKLQQVIINLLDNAVQHSPDESEIQLIICKHKDAYARISVKDKGTGIPLEHLSNVLEPFFTMRRGGTGLGLSIVKHFVELHGGDIEIYNNTPPPGCTVDIYIPLKKEVEDEGQHTYS
jgi:signal transduction histidine kinase